MNPESALSMAPRQGAVRSRDALKGPGCMAVLVGLLFASQWLVGNAAPTDNAPRVLVLYANDRLLPADIEGERGFRHALAEHRNPVDICDEFLDVHRFSGATYEETLASYLHNKYASKAPVVVVVGGGQALEFALRFRAQLFPQAPLVHMGAYLRYIQSIPNKPPDLLGVPLQFDFTGTVEQALRSSPDAKKLVVVTGAGPEDRSFEAELRREFSQFASRVQIEFLAGLPAAELTARLRALKTDTIVFTPGYFLDGSGHAVFPVQAAETIAAASAAPV
jgi:hypothetical protein